MSEPVYQFVDFTLDLGERRLFRAGRPVHLNARYFDALALLVGESGRLVGKERFFNDVWQGVIVGDEALTQCIKTLRRLLGDDAGQPRYIETVPKHGYRFVAPVTVASGAMQRSVPAEKGNIAATDLSRAARLIAGGMLGGLTAGAAGGLVYGAAVALGPGPLPGAAVILLAVVAICAFVGGLGALGVSAGLVLGTLGKARWWPLAGAAAGGLVVGGLSNLIGRDAFALLLGVTPEKITGAAEGAVIGAVVGLAWLFSGRSILAAMAIGCALAGLLIVLAGGTMMAGSLDDLAMALHAASLPIDRLAPFLPEQPLGLAAEVLLSAVEGLVFGAGLAAGLLFASRATPSLLSEISPDAHAGARRPALGFQSLLSTWRPFMADEGSNWLWRQRWRIARWLAAAALLLVPLVAMQFTSEVGWTLGDFIFFGTMLTVFGLLFEISLSWSASPTYRAAMVVALATGFLLVWVNLAVGLIGSEDNAFNLLYFAVLLVGALVAAHARFEAEGMGRALFATAAAQVLVAAIALAAGAEAMQPIAILRLLGATGFFTLFWLIAAALFRRAARENMQPQH